METKIMRVKGTNTRGEEVEFAAYFCTCPMIQDDVCGHWRITHREDCELGLADRHPETVKSCSGGWFGSRSYLNSKEQLANSRKMRSLVSGIPWDAYTERQLKGEEDAN